LIKDLMDYDAAPSIRKDAQRLWAGAELEGLLAGTPDAREAILESLVAIWRLREKEEAGAEDIEWQNHLEAWLVRRGHFFIAIDPYPFSDSSQGTLHCREDSSR
jgi:hypothetical protein